MDKKRGLGKSGLGKGLGALISDQSQIQSPQQQNSIEIDMDSISGNPNQPRKIFDEDALLELSESIKLHGVIQPIIVYQDDKNYVIIAGERRFRGAKIAGLERIPAIVREKTEDVLTYQLALIENIQRENLNAIEESASYRTLSEDYGLSQEEIAKAVGKKRATVANIMRLMQLDERVQNFIKENRLSAGHGKALLAIPDKAVQFELAEHIIEESLSVRESERLVENVLNPQERVKRSTAVMPVYQRIESDLKQVLGTKVAIKSKKKGGVIQIEYYSDDDLDRVITLIRK